MTGMQVFWHRRDLRSADNMGLAAAASAVDDGEFGPVVPVFCFDDAVLAFAGAPRVAFMLDALTALREWYRAHGSDLVVRHGDPSDVVPDVVAEFDAERVVWNADYSGLADERDQAVRAALEDASIPYQEFDDAVLHVPGSIRTTSGDPYSVYTYFWKRWQDREKQQVAATPTDAHLASIKDETPIPSLDDLGFDAPAATLPDAGTVAARERLDAFLDGPIYRYGHARDRPAVAGTSRLSQDLKFGTIGVREVYHAAAAAKDAAPNDDARQSAESFVAQLAWREFYTQVLAFNPNVVTANYTDYQNPIAWRNDPDELAAWRAGETGYPIVDAGMRQLQAEAYMHNRLRMITASFLTKDLLCDWRHGYAHFREHLVDHDTANDTGGWQWSASTGTDAQPYFRVFNPTTQGERHDPDATYIKRYVPELRDVPAAKIHAWPTLSDAERTELAPAYPAPIVDHTERRETAISVFETARGG